MAIAVNGCIIYATLGAAGFATPPLTFRAHPKARGKAQNVTDGITNPVRRCRLTVIIQRFHILIVTIKNYGHNFKLLIQ